MGCLLVTTGIGNSAVVGWQCCPAYDVIASGYVSSIQIDRGSYGLIGSRIE